MQKNTVFNIYKSVALAYEVTKKCGYDDNKSKINYLKLMKLMYLVERQHYESFGAFVTNDTFVSMKSGPVLSNTYNAIKGDMWDNQQQRYWNNYFSTHIDTQRRIWDIIIINSPKDSYLVKQEISVIDVISEIFGRYNEFELVEYAHNHLKEWDETVGASSSPITPQAIKQNIRGLSVKKISAMVEQCNV